MNARGVSDSGYCFSLFHRKKSISFLNKQLLLTFLTQVKFLGKKVTKTMKIKQLVTHTV